MLWHKIWRLITGPVKQVSFLACSDTNIWQSITIKVMHFPVNLLTKLFTRYILIKYYDDC